MKNMFSSFVGLLLAVAILITATPAMAVLKDFGPVDAANGYPVWYRDFSSNVSITDQSFPQGLPLELCDSMTQNANGYLCNLLPEDPDPAAGIPGYDPAQPRDFATNFPHESFYFLADSALAGGADISAAGLTMGLEAAFGGDVAPGNQITFARIRVRVDVTTPGIYRITHPYGVLVFPDVPAGDRTINYTEDIGIGNPGEFAGALDGKVGPFLTWDTDFPVMVGDEVFVGDPAIPHTVTGSPFGTNFFRVERIDAQGNMITSVETDLFNITGKVYTTPIPSPLTVQRASYARNAEFARIDVFAQANVVSNSPPALSNLEVTGTNIPATPMESDGAGNFFAHITGLTPGELPASVTVTNLGDVPPTAVEASLKDEVTITKALFDSDASSLSIEALSSDALLNPALITPYGTMTNGILSVASVVAPPANISVESAAGGVDLEPVTTSNVAPTTVTLAGNPSEPIVVDGTTVAFIATGNGGSGSYEYQFRIRDLATGTWLLRGEFSPINTLDWDTTDLSGAYRVIVYLKNTASATIDAVAYLNYEVSATPPAPPVEGVTLLADQTSPVTAGTTVNFTGTGSGGSGNYEYRFRVRDLSNASWVDDSGFTTNGSYPWETIGLSGDYRVIVYVRNAGTSGSGDALTYSTFTVN